MKTKYFLRNKLAVGLSLAMILALAFTIVALADTIIEDADGVVVGNQSLQNLCTVDPGAILNPKISLKLVRAGKAHVDEGQTVNITFKPARSTVPSGGSLSATAASIGAIPASWPDDTTGGSLCAGALHPALLGLAKKHGGRRNAGSTRGCGSKQCFGDFRPGRKIPGGGWRPVGPGFRGASGHNRAGDRRKDHLLAISYGVLSARHYPGGWSFRWAARSLVNSGWCPRKKFWWLSQLVQRDSFFPGRGIPGSHL